MAAKAGMRPTETDVTPPGDVWIVLEGYERRERDEWERTRWLGFITARFGNSDPHKFPSSPQKFNPFPWDEKPKSQSSEIREQWLRKKALREQLKKQGNG